MEVKSGGEKNCLAEAFYYTQKHKMQLIGSETHSFKDAKLKQKPQPPKISHGIKTPIRTNSLLLQSIITCCLKINKPKLAQFSKVKNQTAWI